MKIQFIGDIHGKENWKTLLNMKCDKFIFTGNYVDSAIQVRETYIDEEGDPRSILTWKQDKSDMQIYNNMRDLIQFKEDHSEDVSLLLGNHDVSYFRGTKVAPGFRQSMSLWLKVLFENNAHLFDIAYQHYEILATHAGVTNKWHEKHYYTLLDIEGDDLAETLNSAWNSRYSTILEEISSERGGTSLFGGPLWAGKEETTKDALYGFKQVVGHTSVECIETVTLNKETSITYIDCLFKDKTFIVDC